MLHLQWDSMIFRCNVLESQGFSVCSCPHMVLQIMVLFRLLEVETEISMDGDASQASGTPIKAFAGKWQHHLSLQRPLPSGWWWAFYYVAGLSNILCSKWHGKAKTSVFSHQRLREGKVFRTPRSLELQFHQFFNCYSFAGLVFSLARVSLKCLQFGFCVMAMQMRV